MKLDAAMNYDGHANQERVLASSQGSAEPAVAAGGEGITAFRGLKSLQPAPVVNFIVSCQFIGTGR